MKKKTFLLLVILVCNAEVIFGQDIILNNFEDVSPNVVSRYGLNFSIVDNPKVTQNTILNNFEPGSPTAVSRYGATIETVANPNISEENNTANCLKVGRTTTNWYELTAFSVPNFTIPANTVQYLQISINYPAQPDIAIRIDGEDENSDGDPSVAIRPLNSYTNYGNWDTLTFRLEGGQNGVEVKAIVIFPDAGFQNQPQGQILNNSDTFGYIDEVRLSNDDGSLPDYENYLTNLKLELAKEWPANRTINLVFHGHSVPSGYYQAPAVETLRSYPHQLLEKLSARYPTAVINTIKTAIGGENSIKGATRFDSEVLVHRPDVLFIDYSINDRAPGLEAAYAAWDEMIKKALARGIKVILLTPSPIRDLDMTSTETDLYLHQQQVIRLAQENGVGLADSFERFKEEVVAGGAVNDYLSSFNHPNEIGHNLISDEVMRFFE